MFKYLIPPLLSQIFPKYLPQPDLSGVVWLVFALLTGTGGFEEFPCFW